ncbi:MAG: cytochrome-c peroxidase [Cyclobacteriaceae bacterium]|nr:cytochrome-c peroxidase [Cyclobacteriaceae bacterium]
MAMRIYLLLVLAGISYWGCKDDPSSGSYPAVKATFGASIDLDNLANYEAQPKPDYILKDNGTSNAITNEGATLGRVLFYDVNLSTDNTISCAHCHKQEFAFSDTATASSGVNGLTGRHSMRLVNSRFATDPRFFWDERAVSLEDQTTQPIQDHKEMGFSGVGGDPSLADLAAKLEAIPYYQELFKFTFGDTEVTEPRLQSALSQFVRSIQSFDTRFDAGRAMAPNDNAPFQNFTAEENQGKQLFIMAPQFDPGGNRIGGGAGCQGCHRSPEFDIDPNSKNNGVVGVIGTAATDLTNTRSPSLRNLVRADGSLLTEAMHDASLSDFDEVLEHYNNIPLVPGNTNLDPRLSPGGQPQKLQLTTGEKVALTAFIKTLRGESVYTDARWSNPFQ